ncbi:MAG: hypothetical protein JO332_17950, partial [Planctomycetaceae bacterium]|nr:hypothetical protein [Planctomycetaceae bacterium]
MPGSPQNRQSYAVACPCGTRTSLDARGFGKPQRCKSCSATFTVAWGRDPGSGKAVPVVMAQRKPASKAPAGTAAPSGAGLVPPPVED